MIYNNLFVRRKYTVLKILANNCKTIVGAFILIY